MKLTSVRIVTIILFLTSLSATAQILPPDFSCTRSEGGGDILTWSNRTSGCGPFEATEIYRATTEAGPYILLTELTDPTTTEYRDENPNGIQRFYFLRYRYDCPGQTVENSDTLDNFIPVTPSLQFLSVEDGDIILNWLPSPSPEVSGYVIFEVTATAFIPIDTVGEVTSYRITGIPADELSARQYRIAAVDPCGNDSPQGTILSPSDLTATGGDECVLDISLQPDRETFATYTPISAVELFVSVDGGPFNSQGTVGAESATITYDQGNDGENLCFYTEAVAANGSGRARSVTFCKTITINQPVRAFALYGVEVTDDGQYRFQFEDNGNQPVEVDADLERVSAGGEIFTADLPGPFFTGGELITPQLADGLPTGETLRFEVTDNCSRDVTTNAVAPVVLRATELFAGQNALNWSPLVNNLDGTTTYNVQRTDETGQLISLASNLTETSFTDTAAPTDGGEVCYVVTAVFQPATVGPSRTLEFNSNRVCVIPVPEVFIPNVFSPLARQDENRTFRPFFTAPPNATDYKFSVYNRWGGLSFLSNDPTEGWDGSVGNQAAASGTYFYVLTYTPADGIQRKRAGRVNLVY